MAWLDAVVEDVAASADSTDWSDEEIEQMIGTVILLAVIGVLSYFFVFKNIIRKPHSTAAAGRASRQHRQGGDSQRGGHHERQDQGRQVRNPQQNTGAGGSDSDGGGISVRLVDGVLPFSYLKAHREEIEDRAGTSSPRFEPVDPIDAQRVMHNLTLCSTLSLPTAAGSESRQTSSPGSFASKKGSNVVVTVRAAEAESSLSEVARFFRLVGSFANLFVILSFSPDAIQNKSLAVPETDVDMEKAVEKAAEELKGRLYDVLCGFLNEADVPRHRVVSCRTAAGRIAFVRQLRPEWTLDYDPSVRDQLGRFGFHVLLYGGKNIVGDGGEDRGLGRFDTLTDFLPKQVDIKGRGSNGDCNSAAHVKE